MLKGFTKKGTIVLTSVILAFSLAGCGTKAEDKTDAGASPIAASATPKAAAETSIPNLTGAFKIDGSSTVFPITQAAAEEFMKLNKDVKITVGESGSSAGFKKIIAKEIDLADASRPVKQAELDAVKANGDELIEMPIALDGLTVVVNKKNTFAAEMTVAELKKIWAKDSTVKKWSEVRAGWPDKEIKLFGPGTASGTFEYFTEAINGKAKESRSDYTPSEDDNVLVSGVAGEEFAMGYFGFAYFKENEDKLNAVNIKVDDASPAVAPTHETINDGSYKPLSRPIFVYPLKSKLADPAYKEFLKYLNGPDGQELVEAVKYVKLPAEKYQANLDLLK
ncbi:MAG: PstS family phosphate ABC transporter substrate-binding protein [Paenibacillaceae bacterium]